MEQQIKKVRAYAKAMVGRLIIADRKLAMLNPILKDENTYKKWDESYGVHGLELMRITLYLDVIRELSAISFDRDKRSPSIDNILQSLQSKTLLQALKDDYCIPIPLTWINDVDEQSKLFWEQKHQERELEEKSKKFDEHYNMAKALYKDLKNSDVFHKMKNIRNKLIAHYEIRQDGDSPRLVEPSDFNLKWGDASYYFEQVKPIMVQLVLLISNEAYALDLFREDHEMIAQDFWDK